MRTKDKRKAKKTEWLVQDTREQNGINETKGEENKRRIKKQN